MPADDDLLFNQTDEPEPRPSGPRFPALATVAGVIWLLAGTLGVVVGTVQLGRYGEQPAPPPGAQGKAADGPTNPCCGLILAGAFAAAGYNTVKGRTRDISGYAGGSLILGVLVLAGAAALFSLPAPAKNPAERAILTAVLVGFGLVVYLVPGILGLVARRQYIAWYRAQRAERKRLRGEFEDEDDRSRRRRD